MENKQGNKLNKWIAKGMDCPIHELRAFAKGLLTDFTAVKNAFSSQWSNGQVEGQINKLKTVKRQMYGRASFILLRKRMILGVTNPQV
jgi:transposase